MATYFDSWRGGGTALAPFIFKPRSAGEVPVTIQGLSGSGATDTLFRVLKSDNTELFKVDNSGNITYLGTGTIAVDTTVSNDLTVNGDTVLGNDTTVDTVTVNAATYLAGSLSVTGNTTFIGDATANHNLTVNNSFAVNGTAGFANGSVTNPSIGFSSDPNTGLYLQGTDSVGITAGGTLMSTFSSSQVCLVPGTTFSGVKYIKGETTTGDATPTAILTLPLADNSVYSFRVMVYAFTDGLRRACFIRQFALYRDGGNAIQLGASEFNVTGSTGTPAVALSSTWVSGTNMVLGATGVAGSTVNWSYLVEYTSMTV